MAFKNLRAELDEMFGELVEFDVDPRDWTLGATTTRKTLESDARARSRVKARAAAFARPEPATVTAKRPRWRRLANGAMQQVRT